MVKYISAAGFLLILAGCSFFRYPYQLDNPWDSNYETAGGYQLADDPSGSLLYSGREGLPEMRALDISRDGNYLYSGDGAKNSVLKLSLSDNTYSFIDLPDGSGAPIDVAAAQDDLYAAAPYNLYRIDISTDAVSKVNAETLPYRIRLMAVDRAADPVNDSVYVIGVSDGIYSLHVLDRNGNETSVYTDDIYSGVSALAVSNTWIFAFNPNYQCIFMILKSDPSVIQAEIYYDGVSELTLLTTSTPTVPGSGNYPVYDLQWDWSSNTLSMILWDGTGNALRRLAVSESSTPLITTPSTSEGVTADYSVLSSLSAASYGGTSYIADPRYGRINNAASADPVYENSPVDSSEFISVSGMAELDSRIFLVDNYTWYGHIYRPNDQSWSVFGTPGIFTGSNELLAPYAMTSSGDRLFIGANYRIHRFFSDGSPDSLSSFPTSIGGTVTSMAAFQDDSLLVWSASEKNLYYFDNTGVRAGPYSDFQSADSMVLFCDNADTLWAAVNYPDHSELGQLSGSPGSNYTLNTIWNSDSSAWFQEEALSYSAPFAVRSIQTDSSGNIWVVFPNIGSVCEYSSAGELIGSFCPFGNFTGQRWLPGRYYNFSEWPGWHKIFSGAFLVDSQDGLWVFDNSQRQLAHYVSESAVN